MKELIKKIRYEAGMSQDQFAKKLGTTAVSINRWENGKTLPNFMAQNKLYEFCIDENVDSVSLIIQKYKYPKGDKKAVFYHGSKKGIKGQIMPISRKDCDFGEGFYMGTDTLQSLALVCSEDTPKFYTVESDLSGLKVINIDIGIDWAMLIAYNRGYMKGIEGTAIYNKYAHYLDGYDVAVGYIVNDRMYTELSRFFDGTITDVVIMKCLFALDLGRQYVALTKKACEKIKILDEKELQTLELLTLRDSSAKRRTEGLGIADAIEKQYRREGKYFDEILKGE